MPEQRHLTKRAAVSGRARGRLELGELRGRRGVGNLQSSVAAAADAQVFDERREGGKCCPTGDERHRERNLARVRS